MTEDYPEWVCRECGVMGNALTSVMKRGDIPEKPMFDVSTFHKGTCGVCGRTTSVTSPRDFFYPDFTAFSKKYLNRLSKQP